MPLLASAIGLAERTALPDSLLRLGVEALVGDARRRLGAASAQADADFARAMADYPIALHPDRANAQHYELPADFFMHVLGPRQKYSSCLYGTANETLAAAELRALAESCEHADLKNGQDVLELGCGWGSLSLWMAETYPASSITAVSNSHSQRAHIEGRAATLGLTNLSVVTADMNDFQTESLFDRVVSIEMFEHMSNWRELLTRMRGWMRPSGRAFIHIFAHKARPYRFDHHDPADWIGRYFFTGGVMPSHGLIRQFGDLFAVEAEWVWNGRHYQRTALHWLENMDRQKADIMDIMRSTYGPDATLWFKRWRLFFLATAGLFGHAGGEEWAVSHYRLKPKT